MTFLAATLTVGFTFQAAAGLNQDQELCSKRNADALVIIAACTRLLETGAYDVELRAQTFNNRGIANKRKNRLEKAIKDYNEAIRLYPKFAEAFTNRGVAYGRLGRRRAEGKEENFKKAINDHDEAIRLDPQLAEAFYNRGLVYRSKGAHDRALNDYNEAIRLNPRLAKAYRLRGAAHQKAGRHDLAMQDYEKSYALGSRHRWLLARLGKINPGRAKILVNRGFSHLTKGDHERALEILNEAIRYDPENHGAFLLRGSSHEQAGRQDQAIEDYKKAYSLGNRNKHLLEQLEKHNALPR